MLFEVGGVTLISRLIDGQFPNYKQLIPETFDYEVAVDHDETARGRPSRRTAGPEERPAPAAVRATTP